MYQIMFKSFTGWRPVRAHWGPVVSADLEFATCEEAQELRALLVKYNQGLFYVSGGPA